MQKYFPQEIEKKWIGKWRKEGINKFVFANLEKPSFAKASEGKEKFYNLVELPYTSGDLHIGHWFTFTTADVLARYKRMNGYDVFFPMGYDAFGLPAENAAIKRKIHPKDWTMKNIENMTRQFHTMGTMLNNWDDVVITCLPEYYRWNQWIFLKMYERGLAYRGKAMSNWCEFDQTVLANENVDNGKCWRCGNEIVQKEVEQWFLKITKYADRLVWDKQTVDWPMQVKVGQNNWIGKKEGVLIKHKVVDMDLDFETFSAYPAWLWADTFIVIAPEHPLVRKLVRGSKSEKDVLRFVNKMKGKTAEERLKEIDTKEGVFTGRYAKDPFGAENMPIWVANFALMDFGTGIIRCSAHDKRDYEFAKKYKLKLKEVVERFEKNTPVDAHNNKGVLKNSGPFTGRKVEESIHDVVVWIEKQSIGKRHYNYHLHDWSVSRQRYWGTPVPMIHCPKDGIVAEEYENLPVELPYEVDFTPKGKPPLATNEKWLEVRCWKCGGKAKRDAETLDTFFDSAWYWFRYVSPHYQDGPFSTDAVGRLTPVNVYFGGSEHTLGHTLYARFFTKFFKDEGFVGYEEFALKRIQHGVVLGPDGNRMSKSKGNVINPDDVVAEYGSDTVRLYLCFMMPYEATGPWSDKTIAGVHRFLNRVWNVFQSYKDGSSEILSRLNSPSDVRRNQSFLAHPQNLRGRFEAPLLKQKVSKNFDSPSLEENKQLIAKLQKTIKKVTHDIEKIKMNTAIAAMMEFLNEWEKSSQGGKRLGSQYGGEVRSRVKEKGPSSLPLNKTSFLAQQLNHQQAKNFLKLLSPFAPFMTEEIWRRVFKENESIHLSSWPRIVDKIVDEDVTIPVQVDGKVRTVIQVKSNEIGDKTKIEQIALKDERVKKYVGGKKYKVIYVLGKILNFVLL